MDKLEGLLRAQRNVAVNTDEDRIRRTVGMSVNAFYENQEQRVMTYMEFLWFQAKYIQKRWWGLQLLILMLLWSGMYYIQSVNFIRRGAGVVFPLFVILAAPELWKNINAGSTEIENTSFFTLRQVYAARLTVIAAVDLLLLTAFGAVTAATVKVTLQEVVIHFMLPMIVTCCICFRTLYSRRFNSEYLAIVLCLIWSVLWLGIVENPQLYETLSAPVWLGMLAFSLIYLIFTVNQLLKKCRSYEEDKIIWN